jgi:hypothetical protein
MDVAPPGAMLAPPVPLAGVLSSFEDEHASSEQATSDAKQEFLAIMALTSCGVRRGL